MFKEKCTAKHQLNNRDVTILDLNSNPVTMNRCIRYVYILKVSYSKYKKDFLFFVLYITSLSVSHLKGLSYTVI